MADVRIRRQIAFLAAQLMYNRTELDAHAYRDNTLGARARTRLQNSEDFEDLMLLNELDRRGRQPGAIVCELAEALEYIRDLEDEED